MTTITVGPKMTPSQAEITEAAAGMAHTDNCRRYA